MSDNNAAEDQNKVPVVENNEENNDKVSKDKGE